MNRNNMFVSVSIVAYETPADELSALLCSLLQSSTLRPWVLVVDNSPSNALQSLVESAGATYLPSPANVGFGAGHNLALQKVAGRTRYHVICNPDIVCGPDVLRQLASFMDRTPEAGLVMPRVLYPDGREQRLCKLLPGPMDLLVRRFLGSLGAKLLKRRWDRYEMRDVDMSVTREVPSLSGCFMFLRTAVLERVGHFDTRYFMYMEDVDLCRRVGSVSSTVFYPQVDVVHGYAKGSYKNSRLFRYHMQSAVRYFNKWGWFVDRERSRLNRRTAVWSVDSAEISAEHVRGHAGVAR